MFNLENENEFLSCCHYSNLQPLIGIDNLEKSNKWNDNDDIFWITYIKNNVFHEIYMPH